MAPISSKPYPIATGLSELSPSSSKKDGFPQLKPSTTLAHLGKNPMDAYLKKVMRHLKDPFKILPEIITHIEVTFSVHSPKGSHQFEFEIEIRQMKMKHPTMLQALGILSQGLLQSIFLLNAVSDELDKVGTDPKFGGKKIGEDEIAKLTKLKKHLLRLTGFLDGILMYYSNSCMGYKAPVVEEIKRTAKKLCKEIRNMKPDKLHRLIPNILVTEEDILCSALGLQCNVARKLQALSPELRNHQTDMYFLLGFLEEHGDYSESLTGTDMVSKLQEMGFTENRSVVIAKWIAEQSFPEHQSLLAWAQHYIESLFKYDIFLNDYVPKYPYTCREEILNEWFPVPVGRDKEDDGGGDDDYCGGGGGDDDCGGGGDDDCGGVGVVTSDVRVINTTHEEASRFIEEVMHDVPQQQPGKFYFHGTDHIAAQSILEDGINLGAGKRQRDFSDGKGFYLSESSDRAIKWSMKSEAGAVLVFNISEDCLNGHRCLDLSSDQRDEDCKMVRRHYRTGSKISNKSLKQECGNCDYIKAPVSHAGPQEIQQQQICIREEVMADSIGNPANICAVIFINTKGQS